MKIIQSRFKSLPQELFLQGAYKTLAIRRLQGNDILGGHTGSPKITTTFYQKLFTSTDLWWMSKCLPPHVK